MFKCNSCGREFGGSQALASHQHYVCGRSLAVRQAVGIVKSQNSRLKTLDSRVETLDSRLSDTKTLDSRLKTLDSRVWDDDLGVYEHQVRELEVRSKLRTREREVKGKGVRTLGIALVLVGVLCYFLGGGKLKLPFFGEPQ